MPLTSRQAFKVGFLRECAEAGLSLQETLEVVKSASDFIKAGGLSDMLFKPFEQVAGAAGNAASGLTSTVGNLGLAGAILGPPAVGAGLGYAASKLTDVDDDDIKAVKKRELIAEYRRQAARIRQRRKSFRLPA